MAGQVRLSCAPVRSSCCRFFLVSRNHLVTSRPDLAEQFHSAARLPAFKFGVPKHAPQSWGRDKRLAHAQRLFAASGRSAVRTRWGRRMWVWWGSDEILRSVEVQKRVDLRGLPLVGLVRGVLSV